MRPPDPVLECRIERSIYGEDMNSKREGRPTPKIKSRKQKAKQASDEVLKQRIINADFIRVQANEIRNKPTPDAFLAEKRRKLTKNEKERLVQTAIAVILQNADAWPSEFVPRQKIPEFTGGTYTASYYANLDSRGEGPEGAFKLGRHQVYPKDKLCDHLIARLEV